MIIDPNKLIDIARTIDPDLQDPEQTLVEALSVYKALILLEKPVQRALLPLSVKKSSNEQIANELLGRQLKRYIKQRGVKLSAVSRQLEVSVSSLSAWIAGKWHPGDKYRAKILALIGGGEYAGETQEAQNNPS